MPAFPSDYPYLGGVAPAADFAAGADLADPAPHERPRREPFQLGPAAAEGAAVGPVRFDGRVAGAALHFVERAFAVPFPAQEHPAGIHARFQSHVLRDERDPGAYRVRGELRQIGAQNEPTGRVAEIGLDRIPGCPQCFGW